MKDLWIVTIFIEVLDDLHGHTLHLDGWAVGIEADGAIIVFEAMLPVLQLPVEVAPLNDQFFMGGLLCDELVKLPDALVYLFNCHGTKVMDLQKICKFLAVFFPVFILFYFEILLNWGTRCQKEFVLTKNKIW